MFTILFSGFIFNSLLLEYRKEERNVFHGLSIQQLVKSLRHYIQSLNRSELTGKRLGPAVTVYFPPLADSPRAADGFLNSSLTI